MVLVRIIDGVLSKGQMIRMMGTDVKYHVERVGVLTPKMLAKDSLGPGEIGFITASIKEVADTRVGDTITDDRKPTAEALPASSRPSRWCSAASSRSMPPISKSCARPWASCASTTPPSRSKWKAPRRSASASAAASSPAAPGNHPGAPEPRVRPRPHRHRTLGRLPADHDGWHREGTAQSGRHARCRQDRGVSANPGSRRRS